MREIETPNIDDGNSTPGIAGPATVSAGSARRRLQRLFAMIGATVVVVVVLLGLLEAGTRLVVGAPTVTEKIVVDNAAYAYHPWSGHRATPGFSYKYMSINSRGWRGPERSEAKPPGVRRLLLLGDSVAFSSYHIRESATIAGYLERFLREKTGGSWEVINMACAGGTSHLSLAVLAHEGIHLAPDVVVALNGNNDISLLDPTRPAGPRFSPVYWPLIQLKMDRLYDPRTGRGHVGDNLAMLLAESPFFRRFAETRPRHVPSSWPDRITKIERVDDFVRNTVALHFLSNGTRAKFVHFLQPYLSLEHNTIGPNEEKAIRGQEAVAGKGLYRFLDIAFPVLSERVRATARTHGLRAVDLAHFFTEENVFGDRVHFIERDADESVFNRRLALRMTEDIAAELK